MVLEGLAGAGCSPRQILNTIFSSHVLPKSPFPNFHLLEHNFDEKALSNEMKIRWKCHWNIWNFISENCNISYSEIWRTTGNWISFCLSPQNHKFPNISSSYSSVYNCFCLSLLPDQKEKITFYASFRFVLPSENFFFFIFFSCHTFKSCSLFRFRINSAIVDLLHVWFDFADEESVSRPPPTKDINPCPDRDSNPWFLYSRGPRP